MARVVYLWRSLSLALTLLILAMHVSAQTSIEPQQDSENAFSASQLDFVEPKLDTAVVGLSIKGKTWYERLSVADFDIYIDDSGRRFIPLLHLLRLLKARGGIENNIITFSVSKGVKASIDIKKKLLLLGERASPIEVIRGVSDLSGKADLFVPEDLIKRALNIDYKWRDAEYAYQLTTTHPLRVFEYVRQGGSRPSAAVYPISNNLVETEGKQQPKDSRQLVSMVDASMRFDTRGTNNSDQNVYHIFRPDMTLYGQVGQGDYYLNLSNNITYPGGNWPKLPTWIKNGQWVHATHDSIARVGDAVIGMSDLVFPSSKFTGVVLRGIRGAGTSDDSGNRFLDGYGFNFMAGRSFSGYAPLGSTVEIYINNRLVDSDVVDESDGAPPGQGRYHFFATGLLNQALNEVRTVTIQPDGTRDEHIESIVGSNALLPPGRSAYSLAIGTKRNISDISAQTYGTLASSGFYYGLTRNATIGMSLATQDDFSPALGLESQQRLSRRSYLGQTLSYRLLDNLIFREEGALNYIHSSGDTSQAGSLALDYITRHLLFSSSMFSYGRNYSNGTTDVSNRRGYALFGGPRLDGVKLGATWAHLEELSGDRTEDYLASQAVFPSLMARSETFLRLDHLVNNNDPFFNNPSNVRNMYSFGLRSGPWMNTKLETDYSWGDRIDTVSTTDLMYGVSIPLVGSIPSYGTTITVEHALSNYSRLRFSYRDYHQDSSSAEFYISRTPRQAGDLDMELRYRRDLKRNSNSTELNLEYPFDQRRRVVVGMNVNYSGIIDDTRYGVYLTMRDLFFYDHGTVGRVVGERQIRPQQGGLKGMVYLDANANGHYDRGEPGVPGVQVLVNGRSHYTSGPSGYFFVGRHTYQDEAVVELDEADLPAIYTPTQGRQRAGWQKNIFTRVYLGVAVLGSISGKVLHWREGAPGHPVPGIIVKARRVKDGTIVKQSITDSDGSYYLGELKPGEYSLELDPNSVPPALHIAGELPKLSLPVSVKSTDIEHVNIRLLSTP